MKYSLLTFLLLSTLLLVWCSSPSSSTPTDTNATVNTQSESDDDSDENEDENDDSDEDSDDDDVAVNNSPADSTTIYTMSDITANNTESSCRTSIRGNVYNLSARIDAHPWGDRNILRLCGIDGTALFEGKHGGKEGPETTLAWFQIGVLQ